MTTTCSSQMGQYNRMEKAMFDYIDCVSDEFFHSVTVNEMEAAMEFFTQITHDKIHTAYATALGRCYRGMDKNH
jgi:hypothetical protein